MIDVPESVLRDTIATLRSCGRNRAECVVYWVGRTRDPHQVSRVVHPDHIATAGYYLVDDLWLTRFSVELARENESVVVQVHTHGGRASHSPTDDEGAVVYQAGFLSLVLPSFAMTDDCTDRAFLVELDERGVWHQTRVDEKLRWS